MTKALSKNSYQTLLSDIQHIYQSAKLDAQEAVNCILVKAYRRIGERIVVVEQNNDIRAQYGTQLLEKLSKDLTVKYGRGFSVTSLRYMRRFYLANPICPPVGELNWTKYRILLDVKDEGKRKVFEKKAITQNWSKSKLIEALKKDKNKALCTDTKNIIPSKLKIPAKLTLKRGTLFTYKIFDKESVDCGFNVAREISIKGISSPQAGTIIESTLKGSSYRFKPSNANRTDLYTYKAQVERIIDGDTILCQIDCGLNVRIRQRLRFRGINTPEIDTPEGEQAKRFVTKALKSLNFIIIKTYTGDKYGRYIGLYLEKWTERRSI